MNRKFEFDIDQFVKNTFINNDINDVNFGDPLKNMVQPFLFPSLAKKNEKTKKILEHGYGSFVPSFEKTAGFLFIPYPVVEGLETSFPFFE